MKALFTFFEMIGSSPIGATSALIWLPGASFAKIDPGVSERCRKRKMSYVKDGTIGFAPRKRHTSDVLFCLRIIAFSPFCVFKSVLHINNDKRDVVRQCVYMRSVP